MKTDDLIAMMTEDAPVGLRYSNALAIAIASGFVISVVLLVMTVGLRHNLATVFETVRVVFKICVTIILAAISLRLAIRVGRPDDTVNGAVRLLLLPLGLVVAAVLAELVTVPSENWRTNLLGQNAIFCLFFVPVLSLPPLVTLFWALKKGAPSNPTAAGAAAGLAAGALAAAIYAWHCPDDSPLFLATWYTVTIAVMAAAGAMMGRKWLRW